MSIKSATLVKNNPPGQSSSTWLGALITWKASKQAFLTLGLLADPGKRIDALRAYAYFRWVDDKVDSNESTLAQREAFIARQRELIFSLKHGLTLAEILPEEQLLVDLMGKQLGKGFELYIDNVMAVMDFDARRRGRLISQAELDRYMSDLAIGVTEALHCFLGGTLPSRGDLRRYAAATGAHVIHMLRDACEDVEFGYFNVPSEYLNSHALASTDLSAPAMRKWVRKQVAYARRLFRIGRVEIASLKSFRLRLAGYAYIARFEILLNTFEREDYTLRLAYPDRKNLISSLRVIVSVLRSAFKASSQTTP